MQLTPKQPVYEGTFLTTGSLVDHSFEEPEQDPLYTDEETDECYI